MHGVWQRYDALAANGDTGSASSARVFTLFISLKLLLEELVTSITFTLRCLFIQEFEVIYLGAQA
jgi:hypothetical protein